MIKKIPYSLHMLLALVVLCGCEAKVTNRDSRGTEIVCFGDSLTFGFGAGKGEDYPSVLRTRTKLPVFNAGVLGDTTQSALVRLEKDVFPHDPKIVIITLGGNDVLRAVDWRETLANAEKIIDRIQKRGAVVVWAAVRTGILNDPILDGLKKMATQKHFILIPDILRGILFDPRYKYDQIHPNSDGYELMADRIFQQIKPLLKEKK
ncbi:MAG: GDSL-type esterase/lipase family protein [Candidatus Omnitrophota bacterium]